MVFVVSEAVRVIATDSAQLPENVIVALGYTTQPHAVTTFSPRNVQSSHMTLWSTWDTFPNNHTTIILYAKRSICRSKTANFSRKSTLIN